MVNSININYIRNLCDKEGFNTQLTENNNLILVVNANENRNYDVVILYSVSNNNILTAECLTDVKAEQDNIAQTLLKINTYNENSTYLTAYMSEDGRVIVSRSEHIGTGVSEEFIIDFIKSVIVTGISFFKDNFNDF